MPDVDWRLIVALAWGGGSVWLYGSVLHMRLRANRVHHDKRSRRDVNSAVAFFIVSLGMCAAGLAVLVGPDDTHGFMVALALGLFLGAGWIFRADAKHEAIDDPKVDE